ncbi:MAG: nitroreductase family protein [Coriobacteriia bacterium]|nr:nitroreductase family protein [Coriobacteriia bacterium]
MQEDFENPVIKALFERHSVRKFQDKPVDQEILRTIVEAGLRAPSSGGTQPTTLLVSTSKDMNLKLGRLSCDLYDEGLYPVSKAQPSIADDPTLKDGFYGAPVVVHCFTPRGYSYAPFDASMAAANMMIAAWSLGVGSCFVSRAQRLFEVDWARDFARENGIPDDYEGSFHLVMGYASDNAWSPKPLYPGRLHWC